MPRVRAVALERANAVRTLAPVLTRLRLALVPVNLAPAACEALSALAFDDIRAWHALARPIVLARTRLAQRVDVDLLFARGTGESRSAQALVVAATVLDAQSVVGAGVRVARWTRVDLAVLARVAGRAVADVRVLAGNARPMLHAGVVQAVVGRRADENIMVPASTRR